MPAHFTPNAVNFIILFAQYVPNCKKTKLGINFDSKKSQKEKFTQ